MHARSERAGTSLSPNRKGPRQCVVLLPNHCIPITPGVSYVHAQKRPGPTNTNTTAADPSTILRSILLQQEGKTQRHHGARPPDQVLVLLDGRLPEALRGGVVDEMLDAVDAVEHKGPGERDLDPALDGEGQGRECGGDAGGLEVPAGEGRDEVANRVGVERSREEHSREALPDGGAEEGLVFVVDLEVGGHGPLQPLLGQDGLAVRRRQGLRRGGANLVRRREGRGCEEGRGLCCCCEGIVWLAIGWAGLSWGGLESFRVCMCRQVGV